MSKRLFEKTSSVGTEKGTRMTHKKQARVLAVILAAVVVFTATYSLILPAIAIDNEAAATEPGLVLDGENPVEDVVELAEAEPENYEVAFAGDINPEAEPAPAAAEEIPDPVPAAVEEAPL